MENRLQKYREKRNFNLTSEPNGEKCKRKNKKAQLSKEKDKAYLDVEKKKRKSGKLPIFVVQHHWARREHYDFRLEWNGVLVSFAVPKGPSFNPDDKRLAVHVEDHPLDYASFEGTIPKGQYGGGTVMLWDEGTYEQMNNFATGLKEGSLKFVLHGKRLCGAWALVKLKDDKFGQDNWLLIKEKDEYVQEGNGISHFVASVKTGRTKEEIEAGEDFRLKKNPFQSVDVKLCKMVEKVPQDDDYVYEIKFDGFRIVSFCEEGKARLFTRNKIDYTKKFKQIADEISEKVDGRAVVFDGEIVALDEDGKPDFQALQNHLKFGASAQIVYMIFDILALDGEDLRGIPLLERKEKLKQLLDSFQANSLKFCEHFDGDGQKFFEAVKRMKLEGVVCKEKSSKYNSRRDENWLKCKCYASQEFVIGGFVKSEKKEMSALVLGVYENEKLICVGRCGTGFDEKTSAELLKNFKKIIVEKCPFFKPPKDGAKEKIFWLKPILVAEIQFAEMTKDGVLRQASFKGLREDKPPKDVVLEHVEIEKVASQKNSTLTKNAEKTEKNRKKSTKKREKLENLVCGIEISNPDKLIYKENKIRKIDVVEYYKKVSERMLAHMSGRVLSVVRCHGDISDCFFKKHPAFEKYAKRIFLTKDDGEKEEYFFVQDEKGLIEQVQLGTLEFHIWGSHVSTLEKPDFMVFDLDPDEKLSLEKVRQGVRDLKKILDSLCLKSFLKTSGGKGYHIVVPFTCSAGWQAFHDFAENVAHLMENKWPERYTTNIRKDTRKGKIFIDFMRNTRGATSVAAYSVRARKGGKVSMPISWAELSRIAPDGVDMSGALARLKKPDPWREFGKVKQKLNVKP